MRVKKRSLLADTKTTNDERKLTTPKELYRFLREGREETRG